MAEAWKWAPLTSLLWWWVAPAALAAAAGARFWPALSLQLSRAYQVGGMATWPVDVEAQRPAEVLTAKPHPMARATSAGFV